MKTICGKQAKVLFVYFVQRDQLRIIAKHLTQRKVLILMWRFRCSSRRSFLKGSLRKDDGNGNGNDNARKQWSDWLNEEK